MFNNVTECLAYNLNKCNFQFFKKIYVWLICKKEKRKKIMNISQTQLNSISIKRVVY